MGQKSATTLKIPTCRETLAFRALCRVLQNDPILKTATTKFVSWTDDDADILEPTYSMCPWLKLTPLPTESDWITEMQHNAPQTVQAQIAVQGTQADNLLNYWALIREAIFPQDTVAAAEAVRTILMDAGVNKPTIVLQGYGHIVEGEGVRMLIANGTIRLNMFVGT